MAITETRILFKYMVTQVQTGVVKHRKMLDEMVQVAARLLSCFELKLE